jgi:hypothetical protein
MEIPLNLPDPEIVKHRSAWSTTQALRRRIVDAYEKATTTPEERQFLDGKIAALDELLLELKEKRITAPADQSDAGRNAVIEGLLEARQIVNECLGRATSYMILKSLDDAIASRRALTAAPAETVGRGDIKALAARFRAAGIHGWAIDALEDLQPISAADREAIREALKQAYEFAYLYSSAEALATCTRITAALALLGEG